MHLLICVFPDERKEFQNTAEPGGVGYLRPAAALRDDPTSSEPISSVELAIITNATSEHPAEKLVKIDPALEAAIATFVNDHLNKQTGLDCYGFVNLVGQKPPHHVRDNVDYWNITPIEPSQITAGSIVAFYSADSFFRHAAVCVAEDLFLSVFGTNGDLEFATFADLKEPYDIGESYLLTP